MSIPASLRGGPTTTNSLSSKKYIIFYITIIWLSLLPVLYFVWLTWPGYSYNPVYFFFMFPLYAMFWYLLVVFDAIIFSKCILIIINIIHKPKEGYFRRTNKNRDYRFWTLRATIKKFALWVTHNCPLPWVDNFAFKLFGVKLEGNISLFDAYVDVEFIEIGNNTTIGQGSVIMSTMVTRDWLIIKKVKIGENVVIGTHSVVSPGSIVGDNSILGAMSATSVGQELEQGWIYMGVPARKYRKNEYLSLEESDEEMARKRELFKQYLTIDEIEEVEDRKSRKELRTEKKQVRITKKVEKKLEKQGKRLETQEKRKEKLHQKGLKQISSKKIDKIQGKIQRKNQKTEKIKIKIKQLEIKKQKQDPTEEEENQNQ